MKYMSKTTITVRPTTQDDSFPKEEKHTAIELIKIKSKKLLITRYINTSKLSFAPKKLKLASKPTKYTNCNMKIPVIDASIFPLINEIREIGFDKENRISPVSISLAIADAPTDIE